MFSFFKRSKSQKSKNHQTVASNAELVNTNFLNGTCASLVLGIQNIDVATKDIEENLKKDEHTTRLNLTSIQHDITSDGGDSNALSNRSENIESNTSYNSKSPSLIRSIMAKGRNRRKYVHTNSGNKNINSNKNTSNKNQNGKVKSQNSVELLEQAEQKIHDENFHNIDNYSDDDCNEKICDFDDVKSSANENRCTENGENSSTNTDATAENSLVESAASIVNDLVYSKYNTVSPIYIKPVNSVCENASDDQCLTKKKMGQETSKNSAVKNMENNSNTNSVQQQDEEVFYEAKDIHSPEIEYKASLLLNVNVDENVNGQFESCDEHKCDSAFNDKENVDSDGAGVLCDSVICEKEQDKEENLKKSLSLKEDSISLPDVVESRCIIVLDQPDLDTKTGKTLAAVDKLSQEM